MNEKTDVTKTVDAVVLEYLKATTSSSDRSRAVLVAMITASVLVFTVIWNTGGWGKSGGGWLDARIRLREGALDFFDPRFDPKSPALAAADREFYGRVEEFLGLAGFDRRNADDKGIILKEIEDLKKIRTEQIRMIRVPFFGVIFDMNDLGLFAGITFTVVLLWLTFSLARERRNLKLTFKEAAERGQTRVCYDLLMMHQVLTVPPMRGQPFGRVWNAVPKLLYLIPAAIYFLQFKTDMDSRPIGNILSPTNTSLLTNAGITLLGLILMFTALCVALSFGADKVWAAAFKEAYPDERREAKGSGRDEPSAVVQAGGAVAP
ncbi:MAG TPA: hypothetical protein VF668_04025 [Pyrinomonadaceae bacterium]|jgi:hypothetical protein